MPNRKVVMEEGTQDKVNTLIARHIDKVSDLSKSQSKVILNHDDRIKDIVKKCKVFGYDSNCNILVIHWSNSCYTFRLV